MRLLYGTISGVPTLRFAQGPAADELLSRDPLALPVVAYRRALETAASR
jgi:hypothetical protein